MFRLKSNALQREFKVNEGYLYASRIRNTRSGMDLVPDGNSTEFTFHFTDGTEFSSKGLKVTDSAERDGKLVFTFEEFEGITVTMRYWVGRDGNTLKKQLQFIQATEDKVIDYIKSKGLKTFVSPFETTIEGESYDQLMEIVTQCQKVAIKAGAPSVSAYVKIVYNPEGEVLTIDQKITKHHQ